MRPTYNPIENPDAYQAAIQRRIKENARKGRMARWEAEGDHKALIERLYKAVWGEHKEDGSFVPARRPNQFLVKMHESFLEWGSLTTGQEAAVRRVLDTDGERKAQWAAERAEKGAKSKHVGEVGKRQVFTLHVDTVLSFDSDYGTFYLHIMRQGDDIVIYKGSKELGGKGEDITVKATIKEHGERDGAKQTVITRPKVEETPLAPGEVRLVS